MQHSPGPSDGQFDVRTQMRRFFAAEEGLSEDSAKVLYSDSKLDAVMLADPDLYRSWQHDALLYSQAQH